MTAEDILHDLKDKNFRPFYFLQGEEPYFIDLISKYIEENALSETERSFNQMIMYGKDCTMHDILSNARRFPMMSEKQVVIVKEAQVLADLKIKENREMLENYIKTPVPTTILVFCHKYQKLDGKTTLAKSVSKHGVLLTTQKLKDYQVPKWISSYLSERKCNITPLAVQLLADHIGNNLERLTNEINKVIINLKDNEGIDEDLISKYVGISKDYNVFELQKAVINRDSLKANKIVKYFGDNPKEHHPIPIIALLYNLFSKILIVHQASDKSQKGLAESLRLPPFIVNEYLTGAKNYSLVSVLDNIRHIHRADLGVKGIDSPGISGGDILRQLVFKLIH